MITYALIAVASSCRNLAVLRVCALGGSLSVDAGAFNHAATGLQHVELSVPNGSVTVPESEWSRPALRSLQRVCVCAATPAGLSLNMPAADAPPITALIRDQRNAGHCGE